MAVSVLKTLWTTVAAIVTAVMNVMLGERGSSVELHVGDSAPDFSLIGSDGRTHSLSPRSDTSAVVLAWFPKAFTGG